MCIGDIMIKNEFISIIGKIKQVKNSKKLTNTELSKISKVPLGTLNKILSGATQSVKAETLDKILLALQINADSVYSSPSIELETENKNFGFVKVGAYTPEIKVADVEFNTRSVISGIYESNFN